MPLGVEVAGGLRVGGRVSVGANTDIAQRQSAQSISFWNVVIQQRLQHFYSTGQDLAFGAVDRDLVARLEQAPVGGGDLLFDRSKRIDDAPTTQGIPMPRPITAAWLVMPPRSVSTAWAACIPRMSSGVVSRRTRMHVSPRAALACASLAVNTILPVAAPGLAGDAAHDHVALGARIDLPVQQFGQRAAAARASPPLRG